MKDKDREVMVHTAFVIMKDFKYVAPNCAMYFVHAFLIFACLVMVGIYVYSNHYLAALVWYFLSGWPSVYAKQYLPKETASTKWERVED